MMPPCARRRGADRTGRRTDSCLQPRAAPPRPRFAVFAALRGPARRPCRLRRRRRGRAGLHFRRPQRSRRRPRRGLPLRPARPRRAGKGRPPVPHSHRRQPVRLLRPGAVVPRGKPHNLPAGHLPGRRGLLRLPPAVRPRRAPARRGAGPLRLPHPDPLPPRHRPHRHGFHRRALAPHRRRAWPRRASSSAFATATCPAASTATSTAFSISIRSGSSGRPHSPDLFRQWVEPRILPRRVPGRGRAAGPSAGRCTPSPVSPSASASAAPTRPSSRG